ncbi:MAG TPA: ATP-binding protein [Ktedonobacterales bacterium]|nr:ATP-binding protein [Ktedonobacterales bacterium]
MPQQNDDGDDAERHAPSPASVAPLCAQCGGAGWVRVAEIGAAGDWRVELAPCACQRERRSQAQWRRALDASDMTPELLAKTFMDYDPSPDPSCVVGRDAALAWAEETPDARLLAPSWLMLYGSTGTGKTHLLAAAFNLLMASGHYPLYTLVPALLDYVRQGLNASDGGGEYAARFQAVQQAPILILDDLGAEMRTPWTDETLFKLLDYRYRRGLPTAVASNLIPAHLEPRIASRLQDRALAVALLMSGPDYRLAPPLAGGNQRRAAR